MPRYTAILLAMATLAVPAAVCSAQSAEPAGPSANITQSQPAPIERAYPVTNNGNHSYADESVALAPGQALSTADHISSAEPVQGVFLRVGQNSAVREVSANAERAELRVEHGVANLNVHDPAHDMLILVDLPGGQTQVLKNGLYTFNANTNTVRVLHGEAEAFPGSAPVAKPIKIKEEHELVFSGTDIRPNEFPPEEASADLIPVPGGGADSDHSRAHGYGPYGDGFYGYPYSPYYAYDYPYGWWGYPYGWYGYPWGIGLGFGYYGGFHGYHGGGFRGGGFHGRR
jgi:hypothetical protein